MGSMNFVLAESAQDNNTGYIIEKTGNSLENSQQPSVKIILNTSDIYVSQKGSYFNVTVTDNDGNLVSNQNIIFNIFGVNYTKITDDKGIAKLKINLDPGNYVITTLFTGNDLYGPTSVVNNVFIRNTETIFIQEGLNNDKIQNIINSANSTSTIEFLGKIYDNISLTVSKSFNIISYCGSALNGNGKDPVLKILSYEASNTNVSGLILSKGSIGISILNSANNVSIKDNVICGNSLKGIHLKNIEYVRIMNNTIFNNYDGIYFDSNNKYSVIQNNTFKNNLNYAINLDKSGEYSEISWNNFTKNQRVISVNCKADGLVIRYNSIVNNEEGVFINKNYQKTESFDDFIFEHNTFAFNKGKNMEGKLSDYDYFYFGYNYVGSSDAAFTSICPKINMLFYDLKVSQLDSNTVSFTIVDKNGNSQNSLASVPVRISFDEGKTFKYLTINNGYGAAHVSNDDGVLNVYTPGNDNKLILENYTPYKESSNPENPENNKGNETSTNSNSNSNSGSGSENADSGYSSVSISSQALNAGSSSVSSSSVAKSSSLAKEASSLEESIVKSLNIDEEIIKITGIGILILFIIFIIVFYYRRDINSMIEKRKED